MLFRSRKYFWPKGSSLGHSHAGQPTNVVTTSKQVGKLNSEPTERMPRPYWARQQSKKSNITAALRLIGSLDIVFLLGKIVFLNFKPVFRPRDPQNRTPRPSNIITNCLLDRFSNSSTLKPSKLWQTNRILFYMSTPRSSKPTSLELFLTNLHSRPSQALGPPQIDAPWKVRPKHGIEIEYGCTEGPTIPKHWSELRNLNLLFLQSCM